MVICSVIFKTSGGVVQYGTVLGKGGLIAKADGGKAREIRTPTPRFQSDKEFIRWLRRVQGIKGEMLSVRTGVVEKEAGDVS